MSLTHFVGRPAIREAFKMLAVCDTAKPTTVGRAVLVPSRGAHAGAIGTAFDYLARFSLARSLHGLPVVLHERPWIAEEGMAAIGFFCRRKEAVQWRRLMDEARAEVADYVGGGPRRERLGELAQHLAHADLLVRSPQAFSADFQPKANATTELFHLLDQFERSCGELMPEHFCALNPCFVASHYVGGADADLIVDERLVEFKTTINLNSVRPHLLQLAGYAALQHIAGFDTAAGVRHARFRSAEIYFARYGKLVRWDMDELFPAAAFHRFCAIFKAEALKDMPRMFLRKRSRNVDNHRPPTQNPSAERTVPVRVRPRAPLHLNGFTAP